MSTVRETDDSFVLNENVYTFYLADSLFRFRIISMMNCLFSLLFLRPFMAFLFVLLNLT